MAMPLAREWIGIQQFPVATQNKLVELLGKLKGEDVNTLTILVMGKGGVGKSSTVNSLLGERVAAVSAFQLDNLLLKLSGFNNYSFSTSFLPPSEGLRPMMCSRTRAGFTLNIIDTPGIVEGGYINEQALDIIKRFLLNKTIDVLLFVERLDAYRVDSLDKQVVKAITETFGKAIWSRSVLVLTHAQLSPPDGLSYEEFFSRRSEAVLRYMRAGSGINRKVFEANPIPVVLVENSGRCRTNELGEKVLPDGTTWIPNLVKVIVEVVSNGSEPILVDQKLIDGPNPNNWGKRFIPLIFALQYFFVIKKIRGNIQKDLSSEKIPAWELRDMGLAKGKF